MSRHILTMFIACLAALSAVQPVYADSVLNDLMPSVFGEREKGPKPEETLIAPFAQNAQGTRKVGDAVNTAAVHHDASIAITTPHRSDTAVAEWASEQTVTGLTYDPSDAALLKTRTQTLNSAFAPSGSADLQTALGKMNIPDALVSNGQKLSTFAQTAPTVTYSGNQYGGVYRWVIDIPVALSVMPVTLKNYRATKSTATAAVSTTPLLIRVQIGRVIGDAAHPDGMVIERFTVMAPSA